MTLSLQLQIEVSHDLYNAPEEQQPLKSLPQISQRKIYTDVPRLKFVRESRGSRISARFSTRELTPGETLQERGQLCVPSVVVRDARSPSSSDEALSVDTHSKDEDGQVNRSPGLNELILEAWPQLIEGHD